ncbi:hypothetical protein vseg_006228 [Gypsophila vaccaria]
MESVFPVTGTGTGTGTATATARVGRLSWSSVGFDYRCGPRTRWVSCSCKSSGSEAEDDFITRTLKQNPSQVEPRFKFRDTVYSLTQRQNVHSSPSPFHHLLNTLHPPTAADDDVLDPTPTPTPNSPVYLNDILREFRGKLYVPHHMFAPTLSQEDSFVRHFNALPQLSYHDFLNFLRTHKVHSLTLMESPNAASRFIVHLKPTPNHLHLSIWALTLDPAHSQLLLSHYDGPLYEIETQFTSSIGQLPDYPNPVASSISSRIVVEFGMVTLLMAAAALLVGSFLASAVFAATSFIFVATIYIVWPVVKPFLKIFLGFMFGILERIWDNLVDVFSDAGIFSKLSEIYTFGGVSASLEVLKPIMLVLLTMVLLVRFTLSRRPKNFRKWDIWQGIDFSQSKPQARVDGSTGVTFGDVAGIEEAVEELQELVNYLKNPDLFDKMGIKPPHGVLLEGPPGCGKTLVAKAIAGEAGVPFYQMAGSEFVEVLVGVGSARIRDLFKRAKVNKPSVIFIDEIDALATRRQGIFSESTDNLYNAATQERETTLNQLLIELDGFDTGKGVIFLGATNRMDLLDPALLRPGRFDRKIRVQPPNAKGRLEILKVHAKKVKLSPAVDLSSYANDLPGWTGARLAQLLQEAALVAARKGHEEVEQFDIDDAVDRLTVGPKRVGIELGNQGQCRRATTEIGTAITSHLLRRLENAKVECCDRVSINPRGQMLSQVVFHRLDDESYMFERRPQLLHRLQVFLGGRAAEEVIYGRDTSKASVNYLADATWLARKIITIWNLENPMVVHGEPPPWRKSPKFVGPRLDFEKSLYDDHGLIEPPINFNLDDQVAKRTEELLRERYEKTVSLLRCHHAALLKTVKVLLNQKEISGAEIDYILEKYPAGTPMSLLLDEEDPGSLPFFSEGRGRELEHALATSTSGEMV